MKLQTIQVGAQRIAYYESPGRGPAVIFVHGNSFSGQTFRHQLEGPLGKEFRLVALDLPGHGQSDPAADPQSTYTLSGYAGIVTGFAEALGLSEAFFVGWSLGGHVLLEATSQLTGAKGFVIFGAPPLAFPPAMSEAFYPHPATELFFKTELTEEEVDTIAGACFILNENEIPESFREEIRGTDKRCRQALYDSFMAGQYRNEVEAVADLSTPIAVLHGERDQLVNHSYLTGLTIPALWRSEVQIISEAGHALHWEQPERFNELLRKFAEATHR